jgi:hypothetical protein
MSKKLMKAGVEFLDVFDDATLRRIGVPEAARRLPDGTELIRSTRGEIMAKRAGKALTGVGVVVSTFWAAGQLEAAAVEDRLYEAVMLELDSPGHFHGHSTQRALALIAGQEIGGEIGGWTGGVLGAAAAPPGANVATAVGGSVVGGFVGDWVGEGAAGIVFDITTRPDDALLDEILNQPYFLQPTDPMYDYWQGVLP